VKFPELVEFYKVVSKKIQVKLEKRIRSRLIT